MLNKQIKVFFVTHMYDLADSFYGQQPGTPGSSAPSGSPTGDAPSG